MVLVFRRHCLATLIAVVRGGTAHHHRPQTCLAPAAWSRPIVVQLSPQGRHHARRHRRRRGAGAAAGQRPGELRPAAASIWIGGRRATTSCACLAPVPVRTLQDVTQREVAVARPGRAHARDVSQARTNSSDEIQIVSAIPAQRDHACSERGEVEGYWRLGACSIKTRRRNGSATAR